MFISTYVILKGCNNRVLAYYLSEKGKQELETLLHTLPLLNKAMIDVSDLKFRVGLLEQKTSLILEVLDAQIIENYYLKLCLAIQGLSPDRSYHETDITKHVDVAPSTHDKFTIAWQRAIDNEVLLYRGSGWFRRGEG